MRNEAPTGIVFFAITIHLIHAAPTVDLDELDAVRAELADVELEDELRRRSIGGPWEPEQAYSILRTALDQLSHNSSELGRRVRPFRSQAQSILSLLTGLDEPSFEPEQDECEPDYCDDEIEVGTGHHPSRATMQKILDMVDGVNGQKKRGTSSIQTLYPWFRPNYVERFRARLSGQRRSDKLKHLDRKVYSIFVNARRKLQPVHGRMIQRWARQYAEEINLSDFRASDSWLAVFKRRNRIVSRKVTSYIGRSEKLQNLSITENVMHFKQQFTSAKVPFSKSEIWNFDQCSFQYEPANLRTLSLKGERDTELLLDNRNKFTHSYTAMPMISRDGKLFPKVLLVLQETNGVFGPKIKAHVADLERRYANIQVFASSFW